MEDTSMKLAIFAVYAAVAVVMTVPYVRRPSWGTTPIVAVMFSFTLGMGWIFIDMLKLA